jgi:hypothetical protein
MVWGVEHGFDNGPKKSGPHLHWQLPIVDRQWLCHPLWHLRVLTAFPPRDLDGLGPARGCSMPCLHRLLRYLQHCGDSDAPMGHWQSRPAIQPPSRIRVPARRKRLGPILHAQD